MDSMATWAVQALILFYLLGFAVSVVGDVVGKVK